MVLAAIQSSCNSLRAAVERHKIAPKSYILALCLVYLMWNIWAARTIYSFLVIPLCLLTFRSEDYRSIARSRIFWLAGCFLGLITLTSLAVSDPNVPLVLRHARHALLVLSFLGITAHFFRKNSEFSGHLAVFLSAAAAIAAIVNTVLFYGHLTVHQVLTLRLGGIPGVTMYYNSNVVGAVYAIAAISAIAILTQLRLSRLQSALLSAASLVLICAVVLTGSRGSIVALTAATLVVTMIGANWRLRAILSLAAALVVLLVFLLARPLVDQLFERHLLRFLIWWTYLGFAKAAPWLGYGLGHDQTFPLPSGEIILNAHNIVLNAQIRGGLLSAAALLALIVASLYQAWRGWFEARVLLPLGLTITMIVATSVDYEIIATDLGYHWLLFWLPVAACLGVELHRRALPAATLPGSHERDTGTLSRDARLQRAALASGEHPFDPDAGLRGLRADHHR